MTMKIGRMLYILMVTILWCSAANAQLEWSDEFNGNGAPDSTVWNFEEGFVRNQEAQWYQAVNAWLSTFCFL